MKEPTSVAFYTAVGTRPNVRDYAAVSQKVNAGRLLAPRTRPGIRARNLLFSSLSVVGPLMKIIDKPASNITLADYPDMLTPRYQ